MSMNKSARYVAPQLAMKFDSPTRIIPFTDDEKASYFWSRYNDKVDPFTRYKSFWVSSAIDPEITIRKLKDFYKKYVLKQGWTEEKFIRITNELFSRELVVNQFSFDMLLKLYDRGELSGRQIAERRRRPSAERIRRRR